MKGLTIDLVERTWAAALSMEEFSDAGHCAAESLGARSCSASLYFSSMDSVPRLHVGASLEQVRSPYPSDAVFDLRRVEADLHCARSSLPVVWGAWGSRVGHAATAPLPPSDFTRAQMALHIHPAHHFTLAFEWIDLHCPFEVAQLQNALHWLHVNCMHAERAAARLAIRGDGSSRRVLLSPEQAELLGWLARGMPEHLLSAILGLGAAEVLALKRSAVIAMSAANETEAVARAAASGLLTTMEPRA